MKKQNIKKHLHPDNQIRSTEKQFEGELKKGFVCDLFTQLHLFAFCKCALCNACFPSDLQN